jgi:hypothetical protein
MWHLDPQDSKHKIKPFWRAPILLKTREGRVQLFTHLGWNTLAGPSGPGPADAWKKSVESAQHASLSTDGEILCLATEAGRLEMWRHSANRLILQEKVDKIREVLATPHGCVVARKDNTLFIDQSGESRELCPRARAMAHTRDEVLVVAQRSLQVFGPTGRTRAVYPVDPGVTAILADRDWFVLGFRDGDLEWVPRETGAERPRKYLEERPSSKVVKIMPGPMGTLIVGYLNGQVGIWELEAGYLLDSAKLHGPAVHMVLDGSALYVATELGNFVQWDLSTFFENYCDLLRKVWREVPIVWEKGLPKLRPPDRSHSCYRSEQAN